MIIAVLDTNVLVSGIFRQTSPPGLVFRAWQDGRFKLVLSGAILNEVDSALNKPYFRQRLSEVVIREALEVLYYNAHVTPITAHVHGVVRDPKDDHIVAAAVSACALYIVSGDDDLLALGVYQGIRVVTPRQFLEILAFPHPNLDLALDADL